MQKSCDPDSRMTRNNDAYLFLTFSPILGLVEDEVAAFWCWKNVVGHACFKCRKGRAWTYLRAPMSSTIDRRRQKGPFCV